MPREWHREGDAEDLHRYLSHHADPMDIHILLETAYQCLRGTQI